MVLTVKPYSTVVRRNSCLHCIMQKLSVGSGLLFVCSTHQCTKTKKKAMVMWSSWYTVYAYSTATGTFTARHLTNFVCVLLGVSKLQLRPLLLRHMVLLLSGLSLLFVRWRVMASSAPTFQRVDNPASFADSFLTRVIK